MIYKFFNKKSKGGGVNITLEFNEQLAKELHKPIVRNLKKERFIQDLEIIFGGADLTDMQLISKFNKGLDFYYVLLIFLVNMLGLFL